MFFSEYYGIDSSVVENYGAVDISFVCDIPLFTDPMLIFNSEKEEYKKLHEGIIKYFHFLYQKACDGLSNKELKAWFEFNEVPNNWLGYSMSGNKGAALGKQYARFLYKNIRFATNTNNITKSNHIEKIMLLYEGSGKDKISDLTVNLIKGFLCSYTEEDHNHSANIFTTKNGVQKYRCCSENLTLNIKQLIEMLGDFKSEFKAIQFIMDIYNLSIKESQWSIEQRENIDMMINNITLNKFQELCPQADKNIKYAKDTFLMMLSIARNNIYSEKFSNDDGEIIFYVTNKKLAEYMGKGNSQKKIDKINKYVKMLIYHDLIRILDNDQIPKKLLKNALKYTNGNKNRVNFYAIPSWVVQQLKTIEDNGIRWKDKGYRIGGVSFDMFYRSEGFEVAASLYPQYKKKKNEYGEIVNRTTTKASDERTLKISEVILHCIQRKGYCTEKEVVYILGNEYRYEVTETQIKRCLNEIMDCYGLKKVKANKVLKEQFDIKSDGYPYIIIEDEI